LEAHASTWISVIFLNLMLSMLAAVRAPVILLSQNRAAAHARLVANHDSEVTLKAEIEIAALHQKLDRMRTEDLAALVKAVATEMKIS
jgi:uncharacterized membrane protein